MGFGIKTRRESASQRIPKTGNSLPSNDVGISSTIAANAERTFSLHKDPRLVTSENSAQYRIVVENAGFHPFNVTITTKSYDCSLVLIMNMSNYTKHDLCGICGGDSSSCVGCDGEKSELFVCQRGSLI